MSVFVLDTNKKPQNPVHPAKARLLLTEGKAAVFRQFPFTIILKEKVLDVASNPLRIKIDPGSRETGIAVINDDSGEIVFAMELRHRGQQIKNNLESRRAIRRSRRNRKTRYRKPRFDNRTRAEGWLPPSLKSRVHNIETWVKRLCRFCNIQAISMELVRFDMQKIQNPEISGVEYQQGELMGYEVREYLLEKWDRTCAYCGKTDIPLEIEHIVPKSKGGSNRISNLTLACTACNRKKGNKPLELFLSRKPGLLKRIQKQSRVPLKDAGAVNATRWDLFRTLKKTGLPVETGSGGLTKFNRTTRGLHKTHWLDAACVGESTPEKMFQVDKTVLIVKADGHGSRQMCRVNKFGFPRTTAKSTEKKVKGFQTGDIVKAVVTSGKKVGTYTGRVAVRKSGSFNIKTVDKTVQGISWKYCRLLHASDGYSYNTTC
ncbi:RNA-guided endonuclease IscB [Desulfobacter latus]|uniref:RRXRR domain-containing protein n=1 Tax=Desulfobacter latus TaxID=2292 RepID=A0A850SXY1_9BACT|nr:RNA-guided endonuclease IscB [Desulfobacter latus]NWH03551.1 RRXRR domain-containing protein [Desulfobacter latus]